MSISRQKSVTRNSIFPKKVQSSSNFGSCSTLDCDVVGEFKKMKQLLHNLFDQAKKQLTLIYKNVVFWVNQTWEIVKNNKDISQKITDKITQVRKVSETVMPNLKNLLINILLVPKIIIKNNQPQFLQNPQSNDYFSNHLNLENKKLKTNSSSNLKIEHSSFMDATIDRISPYKLKPSIIYLIKGQIKNVQDLKILQNNSQKLQSIDLQAKSFIQSYNFSDFKAPNLQILNLQKNDIIDLSCLKYTNFPSLTDLNLSKNKIRNIQNLSQVSFPKLIILNLSNNSIVNIQSLNKCQFKELLQLNLSFNRIENVEIFNRCNFGNLQILNLDNNALKTISSLEKSIFYRLKVLTFAHNYITQINFLSKLSLRRLQAIIGHHNKIFSIESLSTATLPHLKQIVLHNNLINDISCIKKMKFPQLTGFDLELNNIQTQNVGCFISSDKSIKQAKKKFPFLQL